MQEDKRTAMDELHSGEKCCTAPDEKHKWAYVTALTNTNYVPGLMALVRQLKKVKSQYKLVVIVPLSSYEQLLISIEEYGILKICDKDQLSIEPLEDIVLPDNIKVQADHFWSNTFFKLKAFSLTQFDKIILIDADMLVRKNIDELFLKPDMSAAITEKCKYPSYNSLNSGLVVIVPNVRVYEKLIGLIGETINNRNRNGQIAGDQDVIHAAFPNWVTDSDLILDEKYNLIYGVINQYCLLNKTKKSEIYVIHFIGKTKPWTNKNYAWVIQMMRDVKHHRTKNIFFRAYVWRQYYRLCRKYRGK